MPRKEYAWASGGQPPLLAAHSVAKHDVYREYLRLYVRTLTTNPGLDSLRLELVDGFSGGGLYVDAAGDERPGSPLVMLEAMAAAEIEAQSSRRKPFHLDVRYTFVDESTPAVDFLRSILRARGYLPRLEGTITLLPGAFESHVEGVIDRIRGSSQRRSVHRVIFVLDQYGYSEVPFPLLRRIFARLPNAEVILTLATDWVLNYLSENLRGPLARTFGDEAAADRFLALRDEPDGRQLMQRLLHEQIHQSSGAAYYTPFFITSRESNRSYWLVHLSPHARARDVMTRLHWALANHFSHYGRPGLNMLGFDPQRPDPEAQLAFGFDQSARERTVSALRVELPRVIWQHRDGVQVKDLYAQIANETPADSEIVRQVLRDLAFGGDVAVLGKGGGRTRHLDEVRNDHIVVPTSQTVLPLSRR